MVAVLAAVPTVSVHAPTDAHSDDEKTAFHPQLNQLTFRLGNKLVYWVGDFNVRLRCRHATEFFALGSYNWCWGYCSGFGIRSLT